MPEVALNRTVPGHLPEAVEYPQALALAGARRWPQHADFSLAHARMRAERGDVVGAVGQAAKAAIETAHAVACRRRAWVLNEKNLVEQTGLADVHARFTNVSMAAPELLAWVDEVRVALARARPD